jgi:hypothetical protein
MLAMHSHEALSRALITERSPQLRTRRRFRPSGGAAVRRFRPAGHGSRRVAPASSAGCLNA